MQGCTGRTWLRGDVIRHLSQLPCLHQSQFGGSRLAHCGKEYVKVLPLGELTGLLCGSWLCGCVELWGFEPVMWSFGIFGENGRILEQNEALALLSRLLVLSPESQGNYQKSTPVYLSATSLILTSLRCQKL